MHHTIHLGRLKNHPSQLDYSISIIFFQEDRILGFLPFRAGSVCIFDDITFFTNAVVLPLKSTECALIVIKGYGWGRLDY